MSSPENIVWPPEAPPSPPLQEKELKTVHSEKDQAPANLCPPPPAEEEIYLMIEGRRRGPYSVDEVLEKLSEGTVVYSTWSWKPGYSRWIRVSNLLCRTPTPPPNSPKKTTKPQHLGSRLSPPPPASAFSNQNSTALTAGWAVLLVGFLVSIIPGLGLAMMVISIPVCIASFILGIIAAARGTPMAGLLLIFASVAFVFIFKIIPWLSSGLGLLFMSR